MPMNRARAKSLIAPPPKISSMTTVSKVVSDVSSVRLRVWLMLRFAISVYVLSRYSPLSSRMRSNTTMVSLTEYPTMVSRAATMGRLSWRPSRQ